jgi:hypothetical protein
MTHKLTMTQRVLLAALILVVDLAIFFFPVSAVFLAYVLIANPPWFRDFVNRLE